MLGSLLQLGWAEGSSGSLPCSWAASLWMLSVVILAPARPWLMSYWCPGFFLSLKAAGAGGQRLAQCGLCRDAGLYKFAL